MDNFNPKQFMIEAATADLRQFVGREQMAVMLDAARGEEGDWFIGRMAELAALITAMPKTYEQDGAGEQAVAHLHYFTAGADWWITEKDSDPDGAGQVQAFGLADLFGYGGELGYISIAELLQNGAELDLHFRPCTLAEIRKRQA